MAGKTRKSENDARDQPVYWFAILDGAVERGEYDKAANAKRELSRLGVTVSFRRPTRKGAAS